MLLSQEVLEHMVEVQVNRCFIGNRRPLLLEAIRDKKWIVKYWILQRLGDWLKFEKLIFSHLEEEVKHEFFPSLDEEMAEQILNYLQEFFKSEIESLPHLN